MSFHPSARLLVAGVLGLAVVQAGAIGSSVAGLTLTRAGALALLAAAALAAWWGARACDDTGTGTQPADSERMPRLAVLVMTGAAALLAAIYLSLWVIAAIDPDQTCDGNAYHIPAIHQWACAGRIHWIAWPGCTDLEFLNGYPKGVETVAYVLATALHSSRWINATNLVFLPLGVLGLAAMCRALGVSSRLSLLAGCTWIGVPVNLFQSSTAYCDSAFASCAIAWFALTFLLVHRAGQGESPGWRVAVPWGAALGLMMAAKGSGVVLGAVGTIGLVLFELIRKPLLALAARRRRLALPVRIQAHVQQGRARRPRRAGSSDRFLFVLRCAPEGSLADRCRTVARLLLVGLPAAFVTGGYWYLRNWSITGSPLHPVGLSILGHTVFPGQTVAATIYAAHNTPPEILGQPWPWQVAQAWLQRLPRGWPDSVAGVDAHLGGLGFLWVAGCVPALLWLVFTVRCGKPALFEGRRALLFLAAIVALALLATPLRWWARYTCWIYAAGIPPLAWLVEQALTQPRPHLLQRTWPAVLLAVALCETVVAWNMLTDRAVAFYGTSGFHGKPVAALRNMFPEARGTSLEAICAGHAAVAVGPLSGQSPTAGQYRSAILGPLSLPIGDRRVVGLKAEVTSADLARLAQVRVRYVIWSNALPLPHALRDAAASVETIGGFVVIHLRPEPVQPAT